MYERFTDRARKVMQLANQQAQRLHHEYITPEHILLGIIEHGKGSMAWGMLEDQKIDPEIVRREVEARLQPGQSDVTMGKVPSSPGAKHVIEHAMDEAKRIGHNHLGTEHLLMGLLRELSCKAADILADAGFNQIKARDFAKANPRHPMAPEKKWTMTTTREPMVTQHGPSRATIGEYHVEATLGHDGTPRLSVWKGDTKTFSMVCVLGEVPTKYPPRSPDDQTSQTLRPSRPRRCRRPEDRHPLGRRQIRPCPSCGGRLPPRGHRAVG